MMSYFRKPGIFLSFGLVFIFAISSYFISSCTRSEKPTVAITQIVSHPSLDEIRKGIIEALEERGYRDGKNIEIIYRNANGDPSLTLPIAQDFVRKKVNIRASKNATFCLIFLPVFWHFRNWLKPA